MKYMCDYEVGLQMNTTSNRGSQSKEKKQETNQGILHKLAGTFIEVKLTQKLQSMNLITGTYYIYNKHNSLVLNQGS